MRHGVSDRGSSLRSWTALTRVRVEVGPGVDTPLPARTESSPVSRETRHQGGRRFLRARRPALKTAVRPYGRKTEQLLATKESVDRRYFTRRACRTTTAPPPSSSFQTSPQLHGFARGNIWCSCVLPTRQINMHHHDLDAGHMR